MPWPDYKKDFPIFAELAAEGQPLIYLDSAATAQILAVVLDAVDSFSRKTRANVHRGTYSLSERATEAFEGARETVRAFLNARSPREIIFTRNTTESINLVALSLARAGMFETGDHIMVSRVEHHSNFLPWQMLRDEHGIVLDVIDVDENGELSLEALKRLLHPRTKLAAFCHVSNVLGTINPIREIARMLHSRGVILLVDAAKSAPHLPLDVQGLGCDFLAFSGHKIGAPMGIGVLWAREELLREMPAVLPGGGTILEVTVERTVWNDLPWKFEGGTPNVEGAVGLAAAIDYIRSTGFSQIRRMDEELTRLTFSTLEGVPGIRVFGPREISSRTGVVSFTIDGIHPHDLATILDRDGIAIRAGHHCAMPLMQHLGVPAVSRASFWVYNTPEDIEALGAGIEKALRILAPRREVFERTNV